MEFKQGAQLPYIDPETGEQKIAIKPGDDREKDKSTMALLKVCLLIGFIAGIMGIIMGVFISFAADDLFAGAIFGVLGILLLFCKPLIPWFEKNNEKAWARWEIALTQYNIKKEQERIQKQIRKLQEEELAIDEANQKYASYFGKDKKFRIANDLQRYYEKISFEAQKDSFQAINDMYADYDGLREKEKNWAIRAGIADGLAGGVAGLATALQIQAENERIRDRNKQLIGDLGNLARAKASLHQLRMDDADAMSDYWSTKKHYSRLLSYESMDPEKLLKMLSPTVIDTEIREETRAIKLKIKTKSITHLMLTKGVAGTVDGGFIAEIWFKDKKIGTAYATLPFDGAESALTMDCVCINIDKQVTLPKDSNQLKITFAPNKLWAVEIKDDED